MADFQLLIDLHKPAHRQGPGGDDETELAIRLAGLDATTPLQIADIGCGTGASTIALAKRLNAEITAVDFLQDFLDGLNERAAAAGVADRITTLGASMDRLAFDDASFDVLWSEGAIYNIGFRRGVAEWRRFLKPDGRLIVSEITWLTEGRPPELQSHWEEAYPEIDVASAKIRILEEEGYTPLGYFALPEHCWLDHYYRPMEARFADFLKQHDSDEARAIVEAERREIELYERYKAHYSYGVYIAKRSDGD